MQKNTHIKVSHSHYKFRVTKNVTKDIHVWLKFLFVFYGAGWTFFCSGSIFPSGRHSAVWHRWTAIGAFKSITKAKEINSMHKSVSWKKFWYISCFSPYLAVSFTLCTTRKHPLHIRVFFVTSRKQKKPHYDSDDQKFFIPSWGLTLCVT